MGTKQIKHNIEVDKLIAKYKESSNIYRISRINLSFTTGNKVEMNVLWKRPWFGID